MEKVNSQTIDNLDLTLYKDYDLKKKGHQEQLLSEAKWVFQRQDRDVLDPQLESEIYKLFELDKAKKKWALFSKPPQETLRKNGIFLHRMLSSSLGYSEEKLDILLERLDQEIAKEEQMEGEEWEQEQKKKNKKNEGEAVKALLLMIRDLNKLLTEIYSQIVRYQKG